MSVCADEKKNRWLAITVPTTGFFEDVVASFLVELSGTGVEFSMGGVTTYLSMDESLTFKLGELDKFLRRLAGDNVNQQSLHWYCKVVYDEDWSESWKAYFKPVKIGEKVIISPSWEEYLDDKGKVVVFIDPGRAFGVGTHPTTQMCIKSIERFAKRAAQTGNDDWTFCDVGCGTGILAIVGAKLGARKVVAVDIDPVAVDVSKMNCVRNDVADRVEVVQGSVENIKSKFSCVAANLTTKLLRDLAQQFKNILDPGGELILSGILDYEMSEIDSLYRRLGYVQAYEARENEWGLLVYKIY